MGNKIRKKASLTLCILMVFPVHIDTISMGVPIVYLKGSKLEFSKLSLSSISVSEGRFHLIKQ